MGSIFNTNTASQSQKQPLSPKRKRQRLGGILIIVWAGISLLERLGSILNDIGGSIVFILITVGFCLVGGLFIYISSRPDPIWLQELEQQKENEETVTEIVEEDTDDRRNMFLE